MKKIRVHSRLVKEPLFALVDDDMYEFLNKWRWSLSLGYARNWDVKTQKHYAMHRLIIDAPKGAKVDHKNRNTLDNRRANLRLCDDAENVWNSKITKERTGIALKKRAGVWIARITVRGCSISLGSFKTSTEAFKAYREASMKYYGVFSPFN